MKMRGSSFILNCGPSTSFCTISLRLISSALGTMVRNFQQRKFSAAPALAHVAVEDGAGGVDLDAKRDERIKRERDGEEQQGADDVDGALGETEGAVAKAAEGG